LSNYLNAYIFCMERIAQCDEVSAQLDKAERRPSKVQDPDYWPDVRKDLEKVRPLIPVLTPVPRATGLDDPAKAFDSRLGDANDQLKNLPRDRKELLAVRDALSGQVDMMRKAARDIGALYEQEAKKVQNDVTNILGKINELMDLQTEASMMMDINRPSDPPTSQWAVLDERTDPSPRTQEPMPAEGKNTSSIRPGVTREPGKEAIEEICRIMVRQATAAGHGGPPLWFSHLINRSNLRDAWKNERSNTYHENPDDVARELVEWLRRKGWNPEERESTALATVLMTLLESVGLDDQKFILNFIEQYNQIKDQKIIADLRRRYPT